MVKTELLIGKNIVQAEDKEVKGQFVTIDGEDFYEIRNYDSMLPFFMSLASDSDHWMFISSTGGLSAGRINPESALFPYYTDDKLQESAETTGSKSIFRVLVEGKKYLWEPFTEKYDGVYKTERNIYKNTCGNKLIFEEKNLDLGLSFRYGWTNSDRFGWIGKVSWKIIWQLQLRLNLLMVYKTCYHMGLLCLCKTSFPPCSTVIKNLNL